jgi:hypothetical protein
LRPLLKRRDLRLRRGNSRLRLFDRRQGGHRRPFRFVEGAISRRVRGDQVFQFGHCSRDRRIVARLLRLQIVDPPPRVLLRPPIGLVLEVPAPSQMGGGLVGGCLLTLRCRQFGLRCGQFGIGGIKRRLSAGLCVGHRLGREQARGRERCGDKSFDHRVSPD